MEFHPPKADICKHCCCCCCSGFQTGKRAFGIDSHFSHTIFIDEIFGKWLCNELHFNSFIGNFIMHALRCKVHGKHSEAKFLFNWLELFTAYLHLTETVSWKTHIESAGKNYAPNKWKWTMQTPKKFRTTQFQIKWKITRQPIFFPFTLKMLMEMSWLQCKEKAYCINDVQCARATK